MVYCWAYHISLAFESCKEKTVFGNVSYLGGKTHGSLEQHHVKRCVFFLKCHVCEIGSHVLTDVMV